MLSAFSLFLVNLILKELGFPKILIIKNFAYHNFLAFLYLWDVVPVLPRPSKVGQSKSEKV